MVLYVVNTFECEQMVDAGVQTDLVQEGYSSVFGTKGTNIEVNRYIICIMYTRLFSKAIECCGCGNRLDGIIILTRFLLYLF